MSKQFSKDMNAELMALNFQPPLTGQSQVTALMSFNEAYWTEMAPFLIVSLQREVVDIQTESRNHLNIPLEESSELPMQHTIG